MDKQLEIETWIDPLHLDNTVTTTRHRDADWHVASALRSKSDR